MRPSLTISLFALLAAATAASADNVFLYNPSLGTGPAAQGWTYVTDPLLGAGATQSAGGSTWVLNTNPAMSDSAGFFSLPHPRMPVLNRQSGYSVRFQARIDSESHVSGNRAGFSLLALGSDNLGIELGFWLDKVWAQSASFVHSEEAAVDTSRLRQYDLQVAGNDYKLMADGQEVLSGLLRDYDEVYPVYGLSNLLFFGDDASSASAQTGLGQVAVSTDTGYVPEPATLTLLSAGLLGLGSRLRRLRRAVQA